MDFVFLEASPISIHALREEGDLRIGVDCAHLFAFLSTPSARRATRHLDVYFFLLIDFYPRPPRGGRQVRFGDL